MPDVTVMDRIEVSECGSGIGGFDAKHYGTLQEANHYFTYRLNSIAWDCANNLDKMKALVMATRAIDALSYKGRPTFDNGFQFPRYPYQMVPIEILNATFEEALSLLNGADAATEAATLFNTSSGYGQMKVGKDTKVSPDWLANGITSHQCWLRLYPWLVDVHGVSVG
jgi:hypothetical protein